MVAGAMLATRSRSIGRLDWWPFAALSEAVRLCAACAALPLVLRGVLELVWALVFVRIFGLGPAAGVAVGHHLRRH
ncbi:MAG: hypothetical protein R3E34_15980 [Rhodocyclaceae bacterium]